jgi:hypothetical protein
MLQPHEYVAFEMRPSAARCDELTSRWVENENHPPAVDSDARNAVSVLIIISIIITVRVQI